MAKILILETATEVCSVALAIDGKVVSLREDLPPANHAAQLTVLIQRCLDEAGLAVHDIDAVAISKGPGSYTGLRVGAAAAKGVCYVLKKPLIAVDTLEGLAAAAIEAIPSLERSGCIVVPMLDARRKEVWTAAFDHFGNRLAANEVLILENNMFDEFISQFSSPAKNERYILAGSGAEKALSGCTHAAVSGSPVRLCSAGFLARLAERAFNNSDFENITYFEPLYMKPPNITVSKNL